MPAVVFLRMTAEFVGADAPVRPNVKRCISGWADRAVGPYTPLKSLPLRGGLKTDVFL